MSAPPLTSDRVALDKARSPSWTARRRIGKLVRATLVVLVCIIALAPFLYVLSTSLKDQRSLLTYPPEWIPWPLYFGNYEKLVADHPFVQWTLNTLFVCGVVTVAKVLFDSMAGYALAKLQFRGRQSVFWTMLATVMVPPAILIIPLFFIVRDLGWVDSYWALILPPLANPIGILMMRSFIQALPSELESAALVDNCNPFQVFWHIVLPLVRPGMAVVAMYTFLLQYTNFIWPLIVLSDEDKYMLTVGLATLYAQPQFRDWGLISSASVLTMLPIALVFIAFQRRFVGASLAGALKE